MAVEPLGNYAVRIHFDDLHSAGIYTWDHLARLGGAEGRWAAMRQYLRQLRAAGLSRDPGGGGRHQLPPQQSQQQQQQRRQQQQVSAASESGGGGSAAGTGG
ncbi:hypothetical protein HYH02_015040 [Chlamydomonas schloesseri]|uniref:Gamma-butyrobetaine hydroxylase-like N-terminal domain-containing protein n=1 Tax=Chlamydomonas schloesseri TaxID=2026947 RepID=A0A835SDD1_9CHLO|nr:hypothetical protein HYH02_015040 [Chlamydomonas schloesseri]|eukprot:KAG2425213.1 hypothetical protein HYH02_015040 [Chlamydomonas schloesseri]